MQYRSLGNSGLKISVISLGAWVTFGKQIDEDQSYLVMKEAYDAGVNFFDNAEAYAQGIAEITMVVHRKKIVRILTFRGTPLPSL